MKKLLLIVNQKSGRDRQKKLDALLSKYLDTKVFTYEIAFTGYQGHAVALAKSAASSGTDIVAAVGGDGSVNEVARGLLGTDTLLAVIPKGSGNGLARALKIPMDTRHSIEIINRQKVRKIDAGFANGHLFLSNAGVGFDSLIARLFAKNTGRGLINYARLVVDSLGKYRCKHYTLQANGMQMKEKAFFVAVANGDQFGYDFKIAPLAQLDDGRLDVCIMKPLGITGLGVVAVQALTGRLKRSRYAKWIYTDHITIARDEPLHWMQVDGDALPVENDKVTIHLQPKAISVIIP